MSTGVVVEDKALRGRIAVTAELNDRWSESERGTNITARRHELFAEGVSVFTIGSCFAQEIRSALNANGFAARPRYEEIDIDPATQMAGPLGHINYYTTFSIRQEIQRVLFGLDIDPIHLPVAPGAWTPRGRTWEARYQDPLRHGVVAANEEAIVDVMAKVDDVTRTALLGADAFVITLGLIESWIDTITGLHAWSSKVSWVSPDPGRFRFHLGTYEENYENVAWICQTLADRCPGKPVIVTVSPVGLLQTYSGRDIVVANTYSKSVLRAVAGAIEADFQGVTYWPSYEFATSTDSFEADGRHVTRAAVDHIVSQFLAAHTTSAGA